MFIDLTEYTGPSEIQADICIVGAGAAGITLALELDNTPMDVCILESGTLEYDVETQSLADGDIIGLPYYPLKASRLRFFGGTTNHWAGIGRPLDPIDFEQRENIPYSGWPITRATLDEYYPKAHVYCMRPDNYDPHFWANPEAPLLTVDGGRLQTEMMLEVPVRFAREYGGRLDASRNIRIFLGANATEFEATVNGESVRKVHARSLSGKTLSVSARRVIIAAGAIENSRLLMCSNKVHAAGLGNDHDLVGRFFMEHPLVPSMEMQLASKDTNLSLYTGETHDGVRVTGRLTLSPDVLREEGILNACATLNVGGADVRIAKALPGILSSIAIWNSLRDGAWPRNFGDHVGTILSDMDRVMIYTYERAFLRPPDLVSLVVQLEQSPNPDSRILLTDETDELGLRKVALDWRMGELERQSVIRFGELIAQEIGRLELGRVRLLPPDEDGWWEGMRGSWHHMGTTRMHSEPTQGVVDADCRVHGMDNLYIAGSSIFTTSGFANPTLTIVALAIRLADHIKGLKS
jgi:choline dehydrogenase-like flavoprotein